MATLPTGNELKRLSLRALVAYTARCARRVLPFYRLPSDVPDAAAHRRAVEQAVQAATDFANGRDPDPDEAARVEEAVIRAVMAAGAGESPDTMAALSSNAAYAAANAVTQALAAATTPGSKVAEAAKVIAAAVTAADAAVVIDPLVRHGAVRDYRSLVRLRLGGFPDHGQPVDAGDEGVLGPVPLTRRAREALELLQADAANGPADAGAVAQGAERADGREPTPAATDPPSEGNRDVEQFRGEEQTLQSLGQPADTADPAGVEHPESCEETAAAPGEERRFAAVPAQGSAMSHEQSVSPGASAEPLPVGPSPADGSGLLQRELHKQRAALAEERRRLQQERESLREDRDRFEQEREQDEAERFRILEEFDARERRLAEGQSRLDADRQQLAEARLSFGDERQAVAAEREAIAEQRESAEREQAALADERRVLDDERRALAEDRETVRHERRQLAEEIAAHQDTARAFDDRVSRLNELLTEVGRWRARLDTLAESAEPLEIPADV